MAVNSYYANFASLEDARISLKPFRPKKEGEYPPHDFVVSKSHSGKVLSVYSDEVWDLRPYRLSGDTGNARFDFSIFSLPSRNEAKWIMFLLLFIVDSGRAAGISVASCMNYFKVIRHLAKYCHENEILISDVLQNDRLMLDYIGKVRTKNILRGLSSILSHLITMPKRISGYRVISNMKCELLRHKLMGMDEDNQHPIIPNRIYSSLIYQLDNFIGNIYDVKDQLNNFLEKLLSCDRYGRSVHLQRKIGYGRCDFKPQFKEAAQEYGLWDLFFRYKVCNIPTLSTFLTRTQHGLRIMVHIFTGMRSSESLSLPIDPLSVVDGVYILSGSTSKLVGQKKEVRWITDREVVKAIEVAKIFARLVASVIHVPEKDIPLFVSVSYLSLNNSVEYDGIQFILASANVKRSEIYNILVQEEFVVTKEDLEELERTNPFRAWDTEKAFIEGAVWRFTIHQFRRSLAFYVAQSALVSLPSLKRQLKHVSREMTIYYSKSVRFCEEFNDSGHISTLMQRSKPDADALAYVNNIISSPDKLYGAHGAFIERKNLKSESGVIFESDRKALVKQFKNGEIAYTETALGACTTIIPCDKRLFRSVASCLACSKSVVKSSRLDRVIEKQELFVSELFKMIPNGIEYRTEKGELDDLLEYKSRLLDNEE